MTRFFTQHRVLILSALLAVVSLGFLLASFDTAQADQWGREGAQGGANTSTDAKEGGANVSWTMRITSFLGAFLLSIGSFFLWVGATILDSSINYFIVKLTGLIGNGTDIGNSINLIWTVVRDICNLAFIFGFIYIGIRTIIDYESSATKRMLASIIIAAFLINFSLFFTKIVIDVGNYIAVEIYNVLSINGSISGSFTEALGVKTIYFFPKEQSDVQRFIDQSTSVNISFFLMATIMLIVAGFVLAAGGILLIVRFVALVLIMCFSPLLFAATIFPATAGTASDLWKKLIHYSFFAPAYLFMLFISLAILNSVMKQISGSATFTAAFGGNQDAFGVMITFAVVIFFLIMSLQISQKFGVVGAEKAVSLGNTMRGKVQSAVGRNTVGRLSSYALEKYEAKSARDARTRANMGTTRRFANNLGKFALSTVGIDDRSIRGTLKAGKEAKFGGSYSRSDDKAYAEETKKRHATSNAQADLIRDIQNGMKNPQPGLPGHNPQLQAAMEKAVSHASASQLEELEQDQRLAIVEMMTQSQIDSLEKSTKLSDLEKEELGKKRSDMFKKKYGSNSPFLANPVPGISSPQDLRDQISKANSDQLNAAGVDFLTDPRHAMRLTGSQMDDLKKKLTPSEYKQIADARSKALEDLVTGTNPQFDADGKDENLILNQKPNDIANMPANVLKALSRNHQTQIPVSALEKIARDGTLTKVDQAQIRSNIDIHIQAGHLGGKGGAYDQWLNGTPIGRTFGN